MNISLKERKLLIKWFDIAVECDTLTDSDLKLYDKISDTIEDDADLNDPLVFTPRKKINQEDSYDYEEDTQYGDMDGYSDEDKY